MWIREYNEIMNYFKENPDKKISIFKKGDIVTLKSDYFDIHTKYAEWDVESSDAEYFEEYERRNIKITGIDYNTKLDKIYYEMDNGLWISGPCLQQKVNYNEPKKLVYENFKILKFSEYKKED